MTAAGVATVVTTGEATVITEKEMESFSAFLCSNPITMTLIPTANVVSIGITVVSKTGDMAIRTIMVA